MRAWTTIGAFPRRRRSREDPTTSPATPSRPPGTPDSDLSAAGRIAAPVRSVAYGLLALVAVVWGVHWVVAKIGLESIPPFTYAVLRVTTGLAVLLGILAARRDVRRPARADIPIVLSVGLGPIALNIALMNLALQVVPAGRSSILNYTMPLWVAIFGVLFFRMRLARPEVAGLVLGLVGIVVLLNPAVIDWGQQGALAGSAMLLASAMVWALATIHIRRHTWHATPLELQPWQLLVAVVPLGLLALVFDAGKPIAWTPVTILAVLYSGPIATAFAYWASQTVTRSLGPLATTTGFLAVPVVGYVTSWLVLGEPLTTADLAGFALILAGVAATSLAGRSSASAADVAAVAAADAENPAGA